VTATGAIDQAEGVAHVVDEQSNAKFEVSFVRPLGIPLFSGDYWILNLGDDYEYAIVGTPRRDYGWVLSRTPVISPQLQELIFNKLRERDYDPAAFQATPQRSVP
jgi:apolipoprotein D and lipocalin family protein